MLISEAMAGARLLFGLPRLLRHPVQPDQARAILARRLARREADFLALVRRAVFQNPGSPYLQLFRLTGCEPGDLERLVLHDGVEGALRQLLRRGVYLTVEEYKGRRLVVRGSSTFQVEPARLSNPGSTVYVPSQTGGSRGGGSPVPIDLAFVREWAVNKCLVYEARGGLDWLHSRWSIPGGATVIQLLLYAAFGSPPVRWFSQIDPRTQGLHPRYRSSELAMTWASRVAGRPLPAPEHVPLDDPLPIARWMAGVLQQGRTPVLGTYVSSAVRVCRAGEAAGLRLRGAHFSVGGEPITAARLTAIEHAGAEAIPRYGSIDAGLIGDGCLRPATADDCHLYQDLLAFVQPEADGQALGLPEDAVLISSLRATAPIMLLNVSLGDRATVTRRACGCPLERYGWDTHLQDIRSFEKLTTGGMTFLDVDVVRVLEDVLPARFGGGPTDYQLLEQESSAGSTRLRLLVHPDLGPLDERAVETTFLEALGARSAAERVMQLQWRESRLLDVERRAPRTTASGKILHLHQERSSSW